TLIPSKRVKFAPNIVLMTRSTKPPPEMQHQSLRYGASVGHLYAAPCSSGNAVSTKCACPMGPWFPAFPRFFTQAETRADESVLYSPLAVAGGQAEYAPNQLWSGRIFHVASTSSGESARIQ